MGFPQPLPAIPGIGALPQLRGELFLDPGVLGRSCEGRVSGELFLFGSRFGSCASSTPKREINVNGRAKTKPHRIFVNKLMIVPLTWKYGRKFHNQSGSKVIKTLKPVHIGLSLTNQGLKDDEL
ncbi:MAG: hypothetical protein EBT92_11550 [Planctomycetes bacterium]|nr:hypothetical protein [Planctomycetota bacterium]NBY03740.1 hypothetical protein [Planctomycetota bacterium]